MKANEESRPHHIETVGESTSKFELIARLNDRFRRDGRGGTVAITRGVLAMGSIAAVMALVRTYDTFDASNDPHGERDFGSLSCGDVKLFWEIDYYDKAMRFGSPNPADPDLTTRVLTVMLADEWSSGVFDASAACSRKMTAKRRPLLPNAFHQGEFDGLCGLCHHQRASCRSHPKRRVAILGL